MSESHERIGVKLPWELTPSETNAVVKVSSGYHEFAAQQTDFTPDGPTPPQSLAEPFEPSPEDRFYA